MASKLSKNTGDCKKLQTVAWLQPTLRRRILASGPIDRDIASSDVKSPRIPAWVMPEFALPFVDQKGKFLVAYRQSRNGGLPVAFLRYRQAAFGRLLLDRSIPITYAENLALRTSRISHVVK